MIDLHFHCLPGIDDGPETWEQAIALCQKAAAEGTRTIVATPHVLRSPWINEEPAVRDRLILRLNALLAGTPSVLAGCEYYFSSDAVQLLERGRFSPLTGMNRSRYLLLEFPPGEMPAHTEAIFHELALMNVTPVVAHPERNRAFASDPSRLERLVARGAIVQITAGSLLGDFGAWALAASQDFFRRGIVHLVASDAHSVDSRPPRLARSREWVRREWGKEAESGLFEGNPGAILRSERLPWGAVDVPSNSRPDDV